MNNLEVFDVAIIGGGCTGGWAAKVLTEGGLKVALLDAGPQEDSVEAFREVVRKIITGGVPFIANSTAGAPIDRQDSYPRQSIQSSCYAFNEATKDYFVDDLDNPYHSSGPSSFEWIRSRSLGGRSNLWGRVTLRMSEDLFCSSNSGMPTWPFRYDEIAKSYARVEKYLHIIGCREGNPYIPDCLIAEEGLPAQHHEFALRESALDLWPSSYPRVCRLREASFVQPNVSLISRNVVPYFSSAGSTIPAAQGTGRLELIQNAVACRISTNIEGTSAKAVEYIDRVTCGEKEIQAKVVVLCASALESTRILLNSKSERNPLGMANSSGVLGHYLMDHLSGPSVAGAKYVGDAYTPAAKIYVPPLSEAQEFKFGAQGVSHSGGVELIAYGEMHPSKNNRVYLSDKNKDKWGIPSLEIECNISDRERSSAEQWEADIKKLLKHAGYDITRSTATLRSPGSAAHEMGTARMGKSKSDSVLNPFCQAWDISNLFLTDGAAFPLSSYHNPTLTMLALTDRTCKHILSIFSSEFR